jgi:pantoate--beta-alanine ligase
MKIINTVAEMQAFSIAQKVQGKKIAVVPTMGYLHNGHLSLIEEAKKRSDIVITTLFVNPTQFAPHEDLAKYPRDFESDCQKSESAGADILFYPNELEMYPIGFNSSIEIKGVTDKFEGIKRPTHFSGVATVVAKLFNCTLPDIAVFGQKDYQQTLVIKKLVRDLNFPIEIIISPTIREADGLAMSSRNTYLSKIEREVASTLFQALEEAKLEIGKGEKRRKIINSIMLKTIREKNLFQVDYVAAANADSFDEPDEFLSGDKIVLLLAVYLGKTRLIDNAVIQVPSGLHEGNF